MSKKIQTLMFLSISVLVFLLYVKIDREKKNNMSADPVASEAASKEPLEKGEFPDRTIEQPLAKGSIIDQIKGKLESLILEKVDEQLDKDIYSSLEWLMEIAEDDMAIAPSDGLAEHTTAKSISEYIKCFSHGALGQIPGDRVEVAYPVARGKTVSFSFEGGDICKSHSNPSVIAQYSIGAFYHHGMVIPQNYAEALKWYMKASKNGFPLADYNLGVMYNNGDGVTQSHKKAAGCYRKAAEQGLSVAQDGLGDMYFYGLYVEQNYTEAQKWYRKAAEQGYSGGQNNLGIMYDKGYGVKADENEAIKWYRKAADRDNADAQYNLGNLYTNYYPHRYDFNEAFKWYRKAAENGHVLSQKSLGIMFQMGRGTEPNYAEATKWYRAAAEQGDPEAMAYLGYLYEHGLGVGRDTIKAKNFYFATAQHADGDSLFSMGEGWELDDCRPNDNAMAFLWYRLSAHKGIKQGNRNCSYLSKKMTAAQISQVEDISRQLIKRLGHDG